MTGAEWKKELRRMPLKDLFRLRDGIELMNGVDAFKTEFSGFGFGWLEALIREAIHNRVEGESKPFQYPVIPEQMIMPALKAELEGLGYKCGGCGACEACKHYIMHRADVVPPCKRKITEDEKVLIGWEIIKILQLRRCPKAADRYQTAWGTKTALGIYETVTRIIAEGAEQ